MFLLTVFDLFAKIHFSKIMESVGAVLCKSVQREYQRDSKLLLLNIELTAGDDVQMSSFRNLSPIFSATLFTKRLSFIT